MASPDAQKELEIAKEHLKRVQSAWDDPTDWADLSLYGFYCLEAAIKAGAFHVGLGNRTSHPAKANAADVLHKKHSLPDIGQLLTDLGKARKATAYGDVPRPNLDPQDTATEIEEYVEAVERLLRT